MKNKILTGIALLSMALITTLNVNAFDPVDGDHDENEEGGGGGNIICEAKADCDLVAGEGYVKCYGYDPNKSCYSYPALGKVKCDDIEHFCQIIPS
jgi:hypothetical protein